MKSEFELIAWIKKTVPRKWQGGIGIGDDAAVLPFPPGKKLVFTADALVEGVDFILKRTPPEQVGRKALAINLSDLAAMGASPFAFLVTLGIPRSFSTHWIEKFYKGLLGLAAPYKVFCAGGDISRSPQFFCSIALTGFADKNSVVTRSGAKPGDSLWVSGRLGGSLLGRHLRFVPRICEGLFLTRHFHPHAMMDISDGLVQDIGHLLKASGVSARLDLEKIPVSDAAMKMARGNAQKALGHALTDGEDFELLFALPGRFRERLEREWRRSFPKVSLTQIGRIQSGSGKIVWCRGAEKGPPPQLPRAGFSHF